MKKVIITVLTIAAIVGCSKEDEKIEVYQGNQCVEFSGGFAATRATLNQWEKGDIVGIFTNRFGNPDKGFTDYINIDYRVTHNEDNPSSSTGFEINDTANDKPIYYPNDGKGYGDSDDGQVSFYAYYPYADNNTLVQTHVSVADQKCKESETIDEALGAIDFMTSTKEVTYSYNNHPAVNFDFDHKLSKIQIVVTANGEIEDLSTLSVTAKGFYNESDYSFIADEFSEFANTDDIQLNINNLVYDTDNKVTSVAIDAIMIPYNYSSDQVTSKPKITFTVGGVSESVKFDYNLKSNNLYTFKLIFGRDELLLTNCTISGWDDEVLGGDLNADKDE